MMRVSLETLITCLLLSSISKTTAESSVASGPLIKAQKTLAFTSSTKPQTTPVGAMLSTKYVSSQTSRGQSTVQSTMVTETATTADAVSSSTAQSSPPSSPLPSSTSITATLEITTTGDTSITPTRDTPSYTTVQTTSVSSDFPTTNTADLPTITMKGTTTTDISTATIGSTASTMASQPSTSTGAPTTLLHTTSIVRPTLTKAPNTSPPVDKEDPKSKALSSGSVAVIVCMFILLVLLVLGGLYYHKFRRTSYGPLLYSHDHGSLGNFTNPMYDP